MTSKHQSGTQDDAPNSLGPDVAAELVRFQDGLAFINAVRNDLRSGQNTETPADLQATDRGNVPGNRHAAASEAPANLGRFDIRKTLGKGGFASVYLAFDPVLNREVAVKVLNAGDSVSVDSKTRFEREARVTALLSHPNIVPVFDAGTCNGDSYIVSKYCQGTSLQRWIEDRDGQIELPLAVRIVAKIAMAVEYAHQRGVIHRDLKPANVMVESTEETSEATQVPDQLRITDFGLAKLASDKDQLETVDGAILGTPAYMSPEQAESDTVTAASDVYSMGVILYRLITGKLPLVGETHLQTIYAIAHEQPNSPSHVNPAVSRDLEAICLKCLQKQPSQRYRSAFELSVDLQAWLAGKPVSARLASLPERVAKWSRRNPVLSLALIATTLALVFAIIQLHIANTNFERAQNENRKANRTIQFAQDTISEMVSQLGPSSSIPVELRHRWIERAVQLQLQLLSDGPKNRRVIYETAESYIALSVLHEECREFDQALAALDEADLLLAVVPPNENNVDEQQSFSRIKMQKADLLITLGRDDEALEILDVTDVRASTIHQQTSKIRKQARLLANEGNLEQAWVKANEARLMLEATPGNIFSRGGLADLLYEIGRIEIDLGRFREAEDTLVRAGEVYDEVATQIPYHEAFYCTAGLNHKALGETRNKLGMQESAKASFERSKQIFDALVQSNKTRAVFQEYAAQVEYARFEIFFDEANYGQAESALDDAQTHFENLPLPISTAGIAKDKVANDNLFKKTMAIEIFKARVLLAETMDKEFKPRHREQATKIKKYLEDCFGDHGSDYQSLVQRLGRLGP